MGIRVVVQQGGNARAKRLRKIGAVTAAVALVSATSAGIAVPPIAAAMGSALRAIDVMGLLSDRSPGVREAGAQSNKGRRVAQKQKKGPKDGMVPDSTAENGTVSPRTFDLSADQAPIPAALDLPEDIFPSSLGSGFPPSVDGFAPGLSFVPISSGLPLTNGIVPSAAFGGGGGGGGVPPIGPNPTPPTPVPPVPPAVPEPSGWAMMIASMFLIGGVMRYRNRSKVTE